MKTKKIKAYKYINQKYKRLKRDSREAIFDEKNQLYKYFRIIK